MSSFDLTQHVEGQTHRLGHTIDFVITRNQDQIDAKFEVGSLISDHHMINTVLNLPKPCFKTKVIKYRKVKNIDAGEFARDISAAKLVPKMDENIHEAMDRYNEVLGHILDKHAPMKTAKITVRQKQPWFNNTIQLAKRNKRKSERKLRAKRKALFKLKHKKESQPYSSVLQQVNAAQSEYIAERNRFVEAISSAKETYYMDKINQCGNDQKKLFSILKELLCNKEDSCLPDHQSESELSERFNGFFVDKISKIRAELDSVNTSFHFDENPCQSSFTSFEPCTESELERIISASSNASCLLDPIPTPLLKQCLPVLLPFLTNLINLSLKAGIFPNSLKTAIVRPLIKKSNLDRNELKNFRPVSNIPYISKLIEKIVVKRISSYMDSNGLNEKYQSAYRKNHGTETALIKIHDDILRALDTRHGVILVMLDLSAAFDTIDHDVLLDRFRRRLGVEGEALKWLHDYHKGRTQSVIINNATSDRLALLFGAPQGSIMGLEDYKVYTLPVGDITRSHGLTFHGYADDSCNHVLFKLNQTSDYERAISKITKCTAAIKTWMTANKLKLNDSKTEILTIIPPRSVGNYLEMDIKIADATVKTTTTAKSLGTTFDTSMTMVPETENRCKSLLFHLRNIRTIRRFISQNACEKLVHAVISSRLDYANALLIGLPKKALNPLQSIQNIAARIITKTRKYDHITPILRTLHWLPVKARIEFKIICVTYRIIHGSAPEYLCDLVTLRRPDRHLRSSAQLVLDVPKSRTKMYGDRAFSVAAPRLWNALPVPLRLEKSYETFKRKLKTYLFQKSYNV